MSYRIRFHPAVADDLDAITRWLIDYAGPQSAARRLDEIEASLASLADVPHKWSRRDETSPGLRAIPAGRMPSCHACRPRYRLLANRVTAP